MATALVLGDLAQVTPTSDDVIIFWDTTTGKTRKCTLAQLQALIDTSGTTLAWGNITGTLSNQTDLNNALSAKAADNAVVHLSGTETITGAKTFNEVIVAEKGVRDKTYTIDLSSSDYTIVYPGIYEVTVAVPNKIIFPDPSIWEGGEIAVVVTDGTNDAAIVAPNEPYQMGTGFTYASLGATQMYIFKSINGKWRGGQVTN